MWWLSDGSHEGGSYRYCGGSPTRRHDVEKVCRTESICRWIWLGWFASFGPSKRSDNHHTAYQNHPQCPDEELRKWICSSWAMINDNGLPAVALYFLWNTSTLNILIYKSFYDRKIFSYADPLACTSCRRFTSPCHPFTGRCSCESRWWNDMDNSNNNKNWQRHQVGRVSKFDDVENMRSIGGVTWKPKCVERSKSACALIINA